MKASIPADRRVWCGFVVDEWSDDRGARNAVINPSGIRKTNKRLGIHADEDIGFESDRRTYAVY